MEFLDNVVCVYVCVCIYACVCMCVYAYMHAFECVCLFLSLCERVGFLAGSAQRQAWADVQGRTIRAPPADKGDPNIMTNAQ